MSAAFAIYFTSVRNLYGDEFQTFRTFLRPYADIARYGYVLEAAHPPGAFMVDRFMYHLIPSARWMTLGPLAVCYLGLIVFGMRCQRHLPADPLARGLFPFLLFLHPHLLMWSNSIRWYSYLCGFASLMIAAALLPSRTRDGAADAPPSWRTTIVLAICAGALLYFEFFFSCLFLAAFGCAWLMRYGVSWRSMTRIAAIAAAAAAMSVPQLSVMLRKVGQNAHEFAPVYIAAAEFGHAMLLGDAILPWHWSAPIVVLGFVLPALWRYVPALVRELRALGSARSMLLAPKSVPLSLAIFVVAMGLVCTIGHHAKGRSYLLAIPPTAFVLASAAGSLKSPAMRRAAVLIVSLWILVGMWDLTAKTNTSKGELNGRPDEVIAYIREQAGGQKAVIVTFDNTLMYEINERIRREHLNWQVCSAECDWPHRIRPGTLRDRRGIQQLFIVETHLAAPDTPRGRRITRSLRTAQAALANPRVARLNPDPWRWMKMHIPGLTKIAANLPEYQAVVTSGPPRADVDWKAVADAAGQDWDDPAQGLGSELSR